VQTAFFRLDDSPNNNKQNDLENYIFIGKSGEFPKISTA